MFQRFVSATAEPTNSNTTSGNGESISTTAANDDGPQQGNLDMPWSKSQEFALRDRLGRFTITVPIVNDNDSESKTITETTTTMQTFTLWRALVEDVTELAGYPLSFLVQRAVELRSEQEQQSSSAPSSFNNEILPFLDDFTFEANGGLSGRIYGISGVADGTRIQTTAVTNVELTLPKRFVRTADGQVVYELGQPAATTVLDTSANSMAQRVAATASILPSVVVEDGSNQNSDNGNELVLDSDLINIAGLTAVVMAGAAAMGSLSHHLTVNVFWV